MDRSDRMDAVGTPQGCGGQFGKTDLADRARCLGQRADRFLDRHLPVELVRIIKIDVVGMQPAQRLFQRAGVPRESDVQVTLPMGSAQDALAREREVMAAVHTVFLRSSSLAPKPYKTAVSRNVAAKS